MADRRPGTRLWNVVRMEPIEGGGRIIDAVACLVVLVVGVLVRIVWDSDWCLLAFPVAIAVGMWTRIKVPTHAREASDD